ncbi:DUF1652 domain-containing protein [Pseudomonas paracarnis]|uniref:DUF1652 domain-containing protein n=1 Tax=Pseudomonas paracarnis TaxID=2750625 RepID=UPI003B8A862B
MISVLELRHTLEAAFLPSRCICKFSDDNTLLLQLTNPTTHLVELTVTGIDPGTLNSSSAIASVISDIKEEVRRRAESSNKIYHLA